MMVNSLQRQISTLGAASSAIAFAVWPMLLSFSWSMDGLGV